MMMPGWRRSAALFFSLVLVAPSALAQQPSVADLKKQIDALTQTVNAMQKDLQEIKALLQGRQVAPPPQNIVMDLADHPTKGEKTATIAMVEFSDHQCPFCGQFARETFPRIDKAYIQTGKLRFFVVDMPLENIHPFAFKAAEAAGCAGEQGKFWEMRQELFTHQNALDQWTTHAEAIGLDTVRFEACLDGGQQAARVRHDIAGGQKAGVGGTPAFFFGFVEPNSTKVRTVTRINGSMPFEMYQAAIEKLLAESQKGGPAKAPDER